jgi:hypothetical protein
VLSGAALLRLQGNQESNVALVDRARDEVFVGEVFHDLVRGMSKRPFEADADLPLIQGSLTEAYGLPVGLGLEGATRGGLKPIAISISTKRIRSSRSEDSCPTTAPRC